MLNRRRDPGESSDVDAVVAAWLTDLDHRRTAGECAQPISSERLVRVATGDAPVEDAAAVRAHVATCLPCLNAYAELLGAVTDGATTDEPFPRDGAFVGRRGELEQLQAALARVVAGEAEVACLSGAPGIGKSRLLDELHDRAAGLGARALRARCVPQGTSAPYRPLLELLQQLCGFDDLDGAEVVHERIESTVRAAGLNVTGIVPFVVRLSGITPDADLGVVPDPSVMKEKLTQALRALVLRASQDEPVVLAVEDLQWCDAASAACLTQLVPGLRAGRVFVLATCRAGQAPDWLDAVGATTIELPPLSPEESDALLRALPGAEAWPPELSGQIVARAQGNPLILEELALALRTASRPDDVLSASESAERVLRRRFEMLGHESRSVLQAAAVVGLQTSLDLLGDIAGVRALAFGDAVAELERSGFLVSGPAHRHVQFRHALIREAVYTELDAEEREALHGAVAHALESRAGDDVEAIVQTLAHHFGLSRDDGKAVDWALAAAAQMARRAANAEALVVLEAAGARLAGMPETTANHVRRIDVVLDQAEPRFGLGQHVEQIQAMRQIQGLVEQAADPRRRATWHYWMGFLHTLTGGGPAEAIEHCRTASLIADAAGIEDVYAYSESCLSQVLAAAGDIRDAIDSGKRALGIFENTRDAWWCCRTLWHLASASLNLGQWRESEAFCERALEHGRSVADSRLMAVAWLRRGAAHVHRGDWETGILFCDEAARLTHTAFDAAMLKVNRGYGLVRGRQYEAGILSIQAGVEWFRRAGLRLSQLNAELRLAEAHLRAGSAEPAATLAREVATGARQLGYRHLEAVASAVLGESLIETDPAQAAAALREAGDVLEEVGALNDLARVKSAQGRLARERGDAAETITLLTSAMRLFETLGTTDEAAAVRAALARAQGRPRG